MSDATPAYEVRFTGDAKAEVESLDGSIKMRLRKALEKKIAVEPEQYGAPLRGKLAGYWKHEFASHRIIYRVYRDRRLVVVCAVGPRKGTDREDVYRQLEGFAKTGRVAEQIVSVLKSLEPEDSRAR